MNQMIWVLKAKLASDQMRRSNVRSGAPPSTGVK